MNCRFCKAPLKDVFIDLNNSPASNSFLTTEELNEPEIFYPLKVYTCTKCFLVQLDEYKKSDAIFDKDYVYFSSYSAAPLKRAEHAILKIAFQHNLLSERRLRRPGSHGVATRLPVRSCFSWRKCSSQTERREGTNRWRQWPVARHRSSPTSQWCR